MDEFLATVGVQAMRYTIRSAVGLTSTYALKQCSRLLQSIDDKHLHSELRTQQKLLDGKIKVPATHNAACVASKTANTNTEVISPALELVEFKSGRGNVFLESAVPLTKALQREIASLGRRIEGIIECGREDVELHARRSRQKSRQHQQLREVIADIKTLLERIDREIPLLQLAITASGETLSTSLPTNISPSRLLQASALLIVGDTQYTQDSTSDGDGNAFEDGDEHEHNEQGLEGTPQNTHPGTPTSLPAHLDPEWMAFEVFEADDEPFDETETEAESDSETECKACDKNVAEPERKAGGRKSLDSRVAAQIRSLSLLPSFGRRDSRNDTRRHSEVQSKIGGNASADPSEDALDFVARSPFNAITSSLSLVEMLIRLASLQEFQQASHLSIPDHVLTFFLEESSTTGLSGEASQAKRWEAKRRVGFDPYTDTPAERT
ncbi:RanGTP-binding protein [Purpureocillium lavendulum]|uniref:RanGTP-binding protein n=1 Tax=Purpureocillium lavendulum TaxID=1247861 RepID=A0AB34FLT3_9HYPO|nr:RanGTP-binding protein [Purpureocillium lavendulum]